MTSLQVRYFLHLCGTKRISETARQLFVAQPAVSKQIAALERELGTALFIRTNRGVELTSAGECYRDFFSESDRKFHCLQAELRRAADLERRSLAVGILENLGLDEVSDVIAQLRSQHPGLRLTVARLDNPTLLEQLFNGRLDAVITFDHALDHRTGVRYIELLLEGVDEAAYFGEFSNRYALYGADGSELTWAYSVGILGFDEAGTHLGITITPPAEEWPEKMTLSIERSPTNAEYQIQIEP